MVETDWFEVMMATLCRRAISDAWLTTLTLRIKCLHEFLTFAERVTFYRPWNFVTNFKRSRHWFWIKLNQSMPSDPVLLRLTLILSSYLSLGISSVFLFLISATKNFQTCYPFLPMSATCPFHLHLLILVYHQSISPYSNIFQHRTFYCTSYCCNLLTFLTLQS
jgi:hypothetical protein